MKRSSFGPALVRLVTKFCLPEVVAKETIIHSLFFQWPISQQGSSYCPETLFLEFGPFEFKVDKSPKPQELLAAR